MIHATIIVGVADACIRPAHTRPRAKVYRYLRLYPPLPCDRKMAADTGDGAIVRRNRPGTKAKDMYNWPDQDFNDMETVLAGANNRNY